jgi:hypothetical protein
VESGPVGDAYFPHAKHFASLFEVEADQQITINFGIEQDQVRPDESTRVSTTDPAIASAWETGNFLLDVRFRP